MTPRDYPTTTTSADVLFLFLSLFLGLLAFIHSLLPQPRIRWLLMMIIEIFNILVCTHQNGFSVINSAIMSLFLIYHFGWIAPPCKQSWSWLYLIFLLFETMFLNKMQTWKFLFTFTSCGQGWHVPGIMVVRFLRNLTAKFILVMVKVVDSVSGWHQITNQREKE